jgi:ATP-dependent helicase/nuclease subunit A
MSERRDITLTAAQRSAGITRIGENLALRSGAGCGKTFVLALRFTELLLAGRSQGNPLDGLVALTFTEKAAAEMVQRVRDMLLERARNTSGDTRQRLLEWLAALPQAAISTIHGFCASLLRANAIEAGVDPDFAVAADDLSADAMLWDHSDRAVLAAVEGHDAPALGLLARMPYDQVVRHVHDIAADRTNAAPGDNLDPQAILERWRTLLPQAQGRILAQNVLPVLQSARAAVAGCRCPDDDALTAAWQETDAAMEAAAAQPRLLAHLAATLTPPGNKGSKKAWEAQDKAVVAGAIRSIVDAVRQWGPAFVPLGDLDGQAAEHIAALCKLAAAAADSYALQKRRTGMLDFTDLLELTDRLLSRNDDLRHSLQNHIRQLLLDEAQDTDAFQLGLVRKLVSTLLGDAAPPEGRLFLVGDPKQSIYRFRGARVEVFEDLCRRLGPGKQEGLDRSFRTHDAGVKFVNHLFAPLMGNEYAPIEAQRKLSPPQPSVEVVLAAMPDDAQPSADLAVDVQALAVAARIREMIDGGQRLVWDSHASQWRRAEYRDIAILMARMTSSLRFEQRLAEAGVPYYVVSGTGFFRQQEVYDVLNALRAIANPGDDIAFAGALRSSLFGLSDNALMALSQEFQPPLLPAVAASASVQPDPDRQAARDAAGLLMYLHARKDAVSPCDLIERLLAATGYEATLLSQHQGRRMLGNVRMLVEKSRAANGAAMSLAALLREVDQYILSEARDEQSAVASETDNVVRLMTIHKAKGLEFPIVILPDLNAGSQPPRGSLLWRPDWGLTLRLDGDEDDADDAAGPVSHMLASALERQDCDAEDIRRFYVAVTRHEDHLVFVGADWRGRDGFQRRGSYLRMLDSVLGLAGAELEDGRATIPYAGGKYAILLRRVAAQPSRPTPRGRTILDEADGADTLASLLGAAVEANAPAADPAPLLGPLPEGCGRCEVAVTALGDFAACPMLYRWKHELRVPQRYLFVRPAGTQPQQSHESAPLAQLDAATAGTLFHRCMELLDVRRPDPAGLVRRVLSEMDMDAGELAEPLTAELTGFIDGMRRGELWRQLLQSRRDHRELDFLLDVGPAVLRGQIDMAFQDADGVWHIVDYKSDRIAAAHAAQHAQAYSLQMQMYSLAARRYTGEAVADATLYFLRPATAVRLDVTDELIRSSQEMAAALTRSLVAARRSGDYARRGAQLCPTCPYRVVCRPDAQSR